MQTFLPYASLDQSVKCLDNRRCLKQAVETSQILNIISLAGKDKVAWANHPAVRMWRGYASALTEYYNHNIDELLMRGFKLQKLQRKPSYPSVVLPHWFGDPLFHSSHRSNLLRKNYQHYSQFGWTEDNSLAYIWPV